MVFFSANDFKTTSGGTIRMYGILNALAENGNQVIFISNASDYSEFHPNILHFPLNHPINAYSKRKFQFLLTYLPIELHNFYYRKLLEKCKSIFKPYKKTNVIFFEYLDNSIGYWLKQNQIIGGYINDIHGIASEEFQFQLHKEKNLKERVKIKFKIHTAKKLDQKVFENAAKLIVPAKAMRDYFINKYPAIKKINHIILPNVLSHPDDYIPPNPLISEKISTELQIQKSDFVLLFAGGFKKSSGILKLLHAFDVISQQHLNLRLIMIGDGPLMPEAQQFVHNSKLKDKVFFTGMTPYNELHSYQDLSHLLICPDDDNVFSHLIVHYKYLDALLANKVVINGNFKSVLEINENEILSLGYSPSSLESLIKTLNRAIENYPYYAEKYANTRSYILNCMTYKTQTKILESLYEN
ncbi:MAG: glycosyltransferase family 4 protein [Flavobacteriaceae bacterium]|nr:glycosyltransferase family 4 protein [Flavobacteriaceae bacterium]